VGHGGKEKVEAKARLPPAAGAGAGGRAAGGGAGGGPARAAGLGQPAKNVSNSSLTFRITITPATTHATAATAVGTTNWPILRRSETKRTSGITANGSCIDRMTWLKTSSRAAPLSP